MYRHLLLTLLLATSFANAQYIDIWTAEEQDFSDYSNSQPSLIPEEFLDARVEYTLFVYPHI